MNARELHFHGGEPANVWFCGGCRRLHLVLENAEQCCKNYLCQYCGADTGERRYTACAACIKQREEAREKDRFDKATKVPDSEWSGWIYADGIGFNEGYFDSVDSLLEHLENEGQDLPGYVWATKRIPIVNLNAYSLIENICEAGYEDCQDDLAGVEEFDAAVKDFRAANENVVSYEMDYSTAVMMSKTADVAKAEGGSE